MTIQYANSESASFSCTCKDHENSGAENKTACKHFLAVVLQNHGDAAPFIPVLEEMILVPLFQHLLEKVGSARGDQRVKAEDLIAYCARQSAATNRAAESTGAIRVRPSLPPPLSQPPPASRKETAAAGIVSPMGFAASVPAVAEEAEEAGAKARAAENSGSRGRSSAAAGRVGSATTSASTRPAVATTAATTAEGLSRLEAPECLRGAAAASERAGRRRPFGGEVVHVWPAGFERGRAEEVRENLVKCGATLWEPRGDGGGGGGCDGDSAYCDALVVADDAAGSTAEVERWWREEAGGKAVVLREGWVVDAVREGRKPDGGKYKLALQPQPAPPPPPPSSFAAATAAAAPPAVPLSSVHPPDSCRSLSPRSAPPPSLSPQASPTPPTTPPESPPTLPRRPRPSRD